MTKVFISYSRKDKNTAGKLTEALEKSELETWIDWENIPPTADWMEQIHQGIESADAFLFLLSPDSVYSEVCGKEVDHAVLNGKRLIPLVARDVNPSEVHPALAKVNWIYCREQDDFSDATGKLLSAIHTDLAWVEAHRRLQMRAIEWEKRKDNSVLLRGKDLREAEEQLAIAGLKDPQPTDLQRLYLLASRRGESRTRNIILAIGVAVMIALILLSVFAFNQRNIAKDNAATAISNQNAAQTAEAKAVVNANAAATAQAVAEIEKQNAIEKAKIARAGELSSIAKSSIKENPPLSLLLATEAMNSADIIQSREALLSALQINESPFVKRYIWGYKEFHLGGSLLAVQNAESNLVVLLNPVTVEQVGQVKNEGAFAISADGKRLATENDTGLGICLWDINNPGSPVLVGETAFDWGIDNLLFSPDGKILMAMIGMDSTILIDVKNFQPMGASIKGQFAHAVFSPDNKLLILSGGNEIVFWDIETQREVGERFQAGEMTSLREISINPAGNLLAVSSSTSGLPGAFIPASVGENILLIDVLTHQQIGQMESRYHVYGLAFSPDGSTLASGGNYFDIYGNAYHDTYIDLWYVGTNPVSLTKQTTLFGHSSTIRQIAFDSDGKSFVSASDNEIILWDMGIFSLGKALITPESPNQSMGFLINAKGISIYAIKCQKRDEWKRCVKNEIGVLNPATNTVNNLGTLGTIQEIVFHPTKNLLAVLGCAEGECDQPGIHLWDIDKSEKMAELVGSLLRSIQFSPDGTKIAGSGCLPHGENCYPGVQFWDLSTYQPLNPPLMDTSNASPSTPASELAFSPDGKYLVMGFNYGDFDLWNSETQEYIFKHETLTAESVTRYQFTPDSQTLIIDKCYSPMYSQCRGGGLYLWDVTHPYSQLLPLVDDFGEWSMALHPDGEMLASGTQDSLVLWNILTRQQIGPTLTGNSYIQKMAFSLDGKSLVVQNAEKLMSWDMNATSWMERACSFIGRNLTRAEWAQYFPDDAYRATCPQWPLEPESTLVP